MTVSSSRCKSESEKETLIVALKSDLRDQLEQRKTADKYKTRFRDLCDLVLDAAHRKIKDFTAGPKREDIVDSILFKASDFVMVHFKDMDVNYAKRASYILSFLIEFLAKLLVKGRIKMTDGFTDSGISSKVNGEHKEKDLEPWDGGDGLISSSVSANSEELESLDTDVSNGWDPNEMFRYNEENYGVVSTYDSSLSSYTVPLERDNSEEYLKREARAAQIAEEIESSSQYKARVALENDDRSEEEKYTAVQRNVCEREGHSVATRENKYVPPGQRSKDGMPWSSHSVRQNSPRMGQSGSGPIPSRTGSHSSDFSPNSGADQRVVNGGKFLKLYICLYLMIAPERCSLAIALSISFLPPTFSLPVRSQLSSTSGSHPYKAALQAPFAAIQAPVSPLCSWFSSSCLYYA
ncbi:unnamed protein product [Ranitomeya imitator]|uniref:LsmAD domain-containing protein n=1 Tax=Ranitomeya imitator TaxID=111125 RepID=A0ABN9MFX8_9NEOB|nr:unnamed protein product [Ranitomeya imitator]